MNRTTIEWVKNPDGTQGYTWNPITGCLNHVNGMCKGGNFSCYAYKLANGRLRGRYLANESECLNADFKNPFTPRFWFSVLEQPKMIKKPSGIFVCNMSDLFGSWLEDYQCDFWQTAVFRIIKECPQHRFYLLTKQPQNLVKFSPFPNNCWVGVTATNDDMLEHAVWNLVRIQAKIKFISFEPLLLEIQGLYKLIDWIIIGAQTKPYKPPSVEWVKSIAEAADRAGIKVFLKNNLEPLLVQIKDGNKYAPLWANGGYGTLRQEFPNAK